MYEKSDGASLRKTSNDLGISGVTLKNWITKYGSSAQPIQSSTGSALSEAQRIRALEKENALLREERDILRRAAKYFAEETNW